MPTRPAEKIDELELVLAARKGRPNALNALSELVRPDLFLLAARLLGDLYAAEDVAQDVLVSVMRGLPQLQEAGKFRPWLYVITVNACRRRAPHSAPLSLPLPEDPEDKRPRQANEDLGGALSALADAILSLPLRQAVAAGWFHFHGADYAQIARCMNIKPQAVAGLLQRARWALRDRRQDIMNQGERAMNNRLSDVATAVSLPDVTVQNVSFGEGRWDANVLTMQAVNRGKSDIWLGIDLRTCTSHGGNWQRQWWQKLEPGHETQIRREYHIRRVLSPWYAVFRGPGLARLRLTLALWTSQAGSQGPTTNPLECMDCCVYQRWFDVPVPADPSTAGAPVAPVLPDKGDVTLEDLKLGPLSPGRHRLELTLRNHTNQPRQIGVHVDTNGWGGSLCEHVLVPQQRVTVTPEYTICAGPVGQAAPGEMHIQVFQFPLNLARLDLGQERSMLWWVPYLHEVEQAWIAHPRWALPDGQRLQ